MFFINRSDLNSLQFQLTFSIPKISAIAHYRSSGVLIMVQATGGGEYWGEYGKEHMARNLILIPSKYILTITLNCLQRELRPKSTSKPVK